MMEASEATIRSLFPDVTIVPPDAPPAPVSRDGDGPLAGSESGQDGSGTAPATPLPGFTTEQTQRANLGAMGVFDADTAIEAARSANALAAPSDPLLQQLRETFARLAALEEFAARAAPLLARLETFFNVHLAGKV